MTVELLDVSELEPPEPMIRILSALEKLAPGHLLRVEHRREPVPLFPMLEELGYAWRLIRRDHGAVTLLIWPEGDSALAAAAGEQS